MKEDCSSQSEPCGSSKHSQADALPYVQLVLPERQLDVLADRLVDLTRAIEEVDPELLVHGVLGGEHGYGGMWDSSVFMMHPFCWCEREDCRWCSVEACGCGNPDELNFVDEKLVTAEEYWRANTRIVGAMPHEVAEHGTAEYAAAHAAFKARIAERDRRLRTVYQRRIHTCAPPGMMADRPEGVDERPSQRAPNFWHKPTGLKVWWYKYIGRSQEVVGPQNPDLQATFAECMADVRARGQSPSSERLGEPQGNSGRDHNPSTPTAQEAREG